MTSCDIGFGGNVVDSIGVLRPGRWKHDVVADLSCLWSLTNREVGRFGIQVVLYGRLVEKRNNQIQCDENAPKEGILGRSQDICLAADRSSVSSVDMKEEYRRTLDCVL